MCHKRLRCDSDDPNVGMRELLECGTNYKHRKTYDCGSCGLDTNVDYFCLYMLGNDIIIVYACLWWRMTKLTSKPHTEQHINLSIPWHAACSRPRRNECNSGNLEKNSLPVILQEIIPTVLNKILSLRDRKSVV